MYRHGVRSFGQLALLMRPDLVWLVHPATEENWLPSCNSCELQTASWQGRDSVPTPPHAVALCEVTYLSALSYLENAACLNMTSGT